MTHMYEWKVLGNRLDGVVRCRRNAVHSLSAIERTSVFLKLTLMSSVDPQRILFCTDIYKVLGIRTTFVIKWVVLVWIEHI
jgi:tRNA pseudouridine-54 N-methylase